MRIRRAHAGDAPRLEAILQNSFENTWLPALLPAAAERYRAENRGARYVETSLDAFRVAEVGDVVAGFVHWLGDFVEGLHVHGDCRRWGVGTLLMDCAEQAMAAQGFAAARLETDSFNLASQAFYLGRGYVEQARYPDEEWDSGFTTILYAKQFDPGQDLRPE
ncbi:MULTISPECIES: GNAT family N-acetyltransferase [unclassified Sphingomonas]|uniref:GNAT family N-acetyltransferase n=2 Tax=Bacteria TaxID=2 RepID=UPI0010F89C81|nr:MULTISPECIES: GNAT family N-acetyltransferase [unclassified Sphingomonas]